MIIRSYRFFYFVISRTSLATDNEYWCMYIIMGLNSIIKITIPEI